jgi:CRISPR/Cas system-associated exonuclease Cas4 (RecB family)
MKTTDREHFSASALRQIMTCGMMYRLQRIDGVKRTHRSPPVVLGSSFHEAIASALVAVRQGKTVEADEVAAWFEAAWARELAVKSPPIRWTAKATVDNQHELGLRMVGTWHEQGLPLFADAEILAVEERFVVPIVSSEGEVLELPLVGYIDCIFRRADGRLCVVDHKTASQKISKTEVELNIQATAYLHAARELGHGECSFEFHSVSKSKTPKFTVTAAERSVRDLDRLFNIARDAERLIDAGIYLPSAPGWQCACCSYGKACREAYAGKAA